MADLCEICSSNARSKVTGLVATQAEARAATLEHISFAVGSINSPMENELESQVSGALQTPDGQEHDLEKAIFEAKESLVDTTK